MHEGGDFYNGLYIAKTVEETVNFGDEERQLCNTAYFILHKFISNNREVIDFFPNLKDLLMYK